MKQLQITLLFLTLSNVLFSQTGTLQGTITDADTKDEIIGASVFLLGTTIGASTDIYGTYKIDKIPAGEHEVQISFVSFEKQVVKVQIKPGEVTRLDARMKPSATLLDAVTITEERTTNTEAAVTMEIKQAKQIASGISKQQIEQSQDQSAAEVMRRIPGVTIIENRFVMIRGINSRYNSVMINNVMAPSTEVNRRTFSFDLISSGSLDRMMVYKTGAAHNPGDFAGGVIKLYTNNSVTENFTTLSLDAGIRENTTFQDQYFSKGSSTDFLGFDRNYRPLPGNFPTRTQLQDMSPVSEERRDAAHSLPNNFYPTPQTAMPDYGVSFAMGRKYNLKNNKKLSQVTSISYSQSHLTYLRDFDRYLDRNDYDGSDVLIKRFEFEDRHYSKTNKINVMSNWSLMLNSSNKITFSNLFNQVGENESILRSGTDFVQRPNDELQNYYLGYRQKTIYMGQLEGDHYWGAKDKHRFNWVVGGSYLAESEPDLRRFRTFNRLTNPEEGFQMILPPSSNLFETGRYYGTLNDLSLNAGANHTIKISKSNEKREINFGVYSDYRTRNFDSRYFSYLYPGFFDPEVGEVIKRKPIDNIFSDENIRTEDGLILAEGTRPIDAYTAGNILNTAYASISYPVGLFNLDGGVRAEHNIQTMESQDDFQVINVNNPVLSILPFLNAGYNLSERSIIRAAYGRTVNRPEFRELAPFVFYDYQLEAARVGNPDLMTATIDNIDVRYEFYPRPGETMSFGLFYKNFNNPIEDRTIIATEQPQFSYLNADGAHNYGAEIEIRKSLKGLTESRFINRLSVNLNASVIVSEVDLGETAVAQDRVRPLQGQSPYIVNTALYYNHKRIDLDAALAYNIFGKRIFSVGDDLFPTIYELERHSMDLTVSKKIHQLVKLKVGIQNILDFPFRFYQDSDRNTIIDDKDHPIFRYQTGRYTTVSLTFDLHKKKQ